MSHPSSDKSHSLQGKIQQEVREEIASPRSRRYRAWLFHGYVALAALAFVSLAAFVRTTPRLEFDIAVTHMLQSWRFAWFDFLMRAVSTLGFDWKAIAAISAITLFLFFVGLRWEAVVGVMGSTGIWALDNIVKTVVGRPRPSPEIVDVITKLDGPSFTSGHVTSFTVFYGYMLFLTFTLLKPSWKRTLIGVVLGTLIGLVGISRVYSGEHWFTDVIGSYLLGSLWLVVLIHIYRWGKEKFFAHQSVAPDHEHAQVEAHG